MWGHWCYVQVVGDAKVEEHATFQAYQRTYPRNAWDFSIHDWCCSEHNMDEYRWFQVRARMNVLNFTHTMSCRVNLCTRYSATATFRHRWIWSNNWLFSHFPDERMRSNSTHGCSNRPPQRAVESPGRRRCGGENGCALVLKWAALWPQTHAVERLNLPHGVRWNAQSRHATFGVDHLVPHAVWIVVRAVITSSYSGNYTHTLLQVYFISYDKIK